MNSGVNFTPLFYNSKSLLLEEKVARQSRDGCGVAAGRFTPHQSAALTASPQGEAFCDIFDGRLIAAPTFKNVHWCS